MKPTVIEKDMKTLDSKEFYTKEWEKFEEIVLDEEGFVYHRRKDFDNSDMKEWFFTPLNKSTSGDAFAKERPSKYKYHSDYEGSIMCWCGNKSFEVIYSSSYETSAKCLSCKRMFVVHDG